MKNQQLLTVRGHDFSPFVSIVIPVYNGANYLREAIDSALAQTYDNFEILVINDGSTDHGETEKIALSYGNKIRYFFKKNGGVASALNMGISEMHGEYFSWLSHDDFYYPFKLQRQIAYLSKYADKTRILVSGYDLFIQEKNEFVISNYDSLKISDMENSVYVVLESRSPGCSMLIHRSHFQRIGLFDENLQTTQDYELWFRMFRHQKILYLPESLMAIRRHSQQGTFTNKLQSHEEQELWSGFLTSLTDDEILSMYKSKYYFYSHFAARMKNAGIEKAYKKALFFLRKESFKQSQYIKEYMNDFSHGVANKVCLFGAGKIGLEFYASLKVLNIEPDFFCDNNQDKIGRSYDGLICKGISELIKVKNDTLIIVTMKNTEEVERQLSKIGCPFVVLYNNIQEKLNFIS